VTEPRPDHREALLRASLTTQGPLDPAAAAALLEQGWAFLAASDFQAAAVCFQRVVGFDDATITAAAWLGLGEALYRLDHDGEALAAWESVLALPETPSTYRAWLNVAGARVRASDLRGAATAYREADRRAPAEDRPMIASRLGWLAKETGDQGSARRYFARSRGDAATGVAMAILAVTVVVSLAALFQPDQGLVRLLAFDAAPVKAGEVYRLLSVTLVHGSLLHLAMNMYALYLFGPLVEAIWGRGLFVSFYVLAALAASTTSLLAGTDAAVGASGAIFGLIGVLAAGTRAHHPVLDARSRAIAGQLWLLIAINLAFGFMVQGIDNWAHIGGLLSGLWLGTLIPPGKVRTLRTFWRRPDGSAEAPGSGLAVGIATAALLGVILAGLAAAGVRL
jgi:membrane associated rhomboid family serine protease